MGNLMQQVSGKADVTVNRNGILISKDGKEGTDLIDEALRYNGRCRKMTTPDAPTQRSPKTTDTRADPKAKSANGNGASPAAVVKP